MATEQIIKSLHCKFSLAENTQISTNIFIINRKYTKGGSYIWRINENGMNNLQIPGNQGIWNWHPKIKNLLVLAVADLEDKKATYRTFIEFKSVPKNFLDFNKCGESLDGKGTLYSPPPWREIQYSLSFGCI